jgi:hypothetical protein
MFTFNRGSWEDGSPLPEWQDDENSDDYRQRIGYAGERTLFGHEYGGHLEIYESSADDSFYASICPAGGTCYEVFLPDLPSFMMFIRDYAAAFSTEATNVSQQQVFDLLEKMFRVQHGHSAQAICQQCDPDAWKAREQRLKSQ